MPEKVMPGPVQDSACIREAVCIHTKKIYDSCKEKDMAFYRYNKIVCIYTFLLTNGYTLYILSMSQGNLANINLI